MKPFRRFTTFSIALILLLFPPGAIQASAQTAASANLTTPDTSKFPQIAAYLDVHDAQGMFVRNLSVSQVTIVEDGNRLNIDELVELKPGAQFVIALNPGRSFAIRDAQGVSRYDLLLNELRAWLAAPRRTDQDDLSIVIPDVPEVTHSSVPLPLQSSLDAYQTNARTVTPDLDILTRAIELASDPATREGMGRGILFITSPPEGEITVGLQSLAARALQNGVHIYIWLVTSSELVTSPTALQLQDLANQTHGQMISFSGAEVLPDLEIYLENLRYIYRFVYDSKASTSGNHQLALEAQIDDGTVLSSPQNFDLIVQPPSPIFLSPPVQIHRASLAGDQEENFSLFPIAQTLEILVEFPDGYQRSIMTTTLFIDDKIAGVNISPPYTRFTWDLSGYNTPSDHRLRVEVVDSLGLRGSTVEIPVHISVESPARGMLVSFSKNRPLLFGLAILFTSIVIALALVLGGRIHPRIAGQKSELYPRKIISKSIAQQRKPRNRGILPGAPAESGSRHLPHWAGRLQWPQRRFSPKPIAYLTRFTETEQLSTPIPLVFDDISVGKDTVLALLVINDPSIEPVHARLHREHNSYRLTDAGSVAGTWVNYLPISQEGVILEHGDLVHLGKIGYRYTLRQPGRIRKPMVKVEDPSL